MVGAQAAVSRALIDQLQTSRRQLEAQVGVARRQIKQLQMEMSELRLAIERMRRQSRFSTSLAATTDRGEPLLSPMSACTPLPAVSAARFSSVGDAAMAAPAVRAWDAERIERARERVAVGGFAPLNRWSDGWRRRSPRRRRRQSRSASCQRSPTQGPESAIVRTTIRVPRRRYVAPVRVVPGARLSATGLHWPPYREPGRSAMLTRMGVAESMAGWAVRNARPSAVGVKRVQARSA